MKTECQTIQASPEIIFFTFAAFKRGRDRPAQLSTEPPLPHCAVSPAYNSNDDEFKSRDDGKNAAEQRDFKLEDKQGKYKKGKEGLLCW